MPVVACPKCPTQLKIPDGAKGNVKCPKCGTIFPAAPTPAAAFEVVDDAPKPAAPSKASAALPKPGTASKTALPAAGSASKPALPKPAPVQAAAADDDDFDVVEDKPKKKSRDYDDDDDDDDRPRSKRKRRDDYDDDDDDDRPRKKKKKRRRDYDDEDDEDDDWAARPKPGANKRGAFAKGKTGALLLSISFWLNMGAYGLLALYALIAWIMVVAATSSSPTSGGGGGGGGGDGSFMDVIVVLPGLLGLGAWIVGLIGCSFAIAGPPKARGMAITATVFAALHLVLTGITFSNMQESLGFGRALPGVGKIGWIFVATSLPALDAFLPLLFYGSKAVTGDFVVALLAAVCEVGRLIFALLALKGLATAARDYDAGEKAQFGVMGASFIVGGAALGVLLLTILVAEGGIGPKSGIHLAMVTMIAVFGGYTFMMLNPALAATQTKDSCARRS